MRKLRGKRLEKLITDLQNESYLFYDVEDEVWLPIKVFANNQWECFANNGKLYLKHIYFRGSEYIEIKLSPMKKFKKKLDSL